MRMIRLQKGVAVLVALGGVTGAALTACGGGSEGASDAAPIMEGGGRDATSTADAATDAPASQADAPPGDGAIADGTIADGTLDGGEGGDGTETGTPDGEAGGDAAESGATDAGQDGCALGASGEYTDLSCAHLYTSWASKTVYSDVVPYDPGLHLWSDGADKSRWIHLPAGQPIDTSDMDEWTFPIGTQIWKEFSLPLGGDGSAPTRIETRLLWKQAYDTWYRTTYRWSADGQTSATELVDGELDVGGTSYEIPTQSDCDTCHDGRKDGVLGFEAVSLSSSGASGLNLAALVAQSLVTAPPTAPLVIPGNATESAALGYLHVNCGTACHNQGGGEANGTNFWMRLDVATLTSVQSTDTYATGWNQPTQAYQIPAASTTYRFHACDLSESAAYYRASHRQGVNGTPSGVQMPPIVSHAIDDAGMATLAAWINEGCDAGTAIDAGAD
jgi:hypothetical protein